MALARTRRRDNRADFWPGFVDAMATLLLVIIFLLSLFMLAQFFLSQEVTSRDTVLNKLNAEIAALKEALALGQANTQSLQETLNIFEANLTTAEAERDRLRGLLASESGAAAEAGGQVSTLESQIATEKRISDLESEIQNSSESVESLLQRRRNIRKEFGTFSPKSANHFKLF